MKLFPTGLLLLIVFGSLEGSTIPHKRTVRALNATIQTHFNGTIQRRNPCNDKEVERSSYKGCHEFHHHSKESNWSDYTRKCATLISDFFHAISNLVTFKDRQSGTFDLNINTKVSHKTDGDCADTKKPICPTPTAIVESTDCEVLPSTGCSDLPGKDTRIESPEMCFTEESVKVDEEDDKCSAGSETSVNGEPQTVDNSSFPENLKCLDVSYTVGKTPEPSVKTTPKLQPTQEVNPPETKPQSEEIPPETIPTYDDYPNSDQSSETTDIESASMTVKPDTAAPSTVTTSAPKEVFLIDVSVIPQKPTGTDSVGQETPSDSKDYLSDYESQTDEEKMEIQTSSPATQPENSSDEEVPEDDGFSIEFSDKLALFNVHEPRNESLQTFSPSTKHYSSDTTTPSTFEIKSDYDYVQDTAEKTQQTFPPQYPSKSYDEPVQSGQTVTFTPVQPEPENYVNQYDQVPSNIPTSFPPKGEDYLELSGQLPVYNVRQPQPESPSSSSLTNEPTSIQPPALPESHSENYVNYEDGLGSIQLPTSTSPPNVEEPSIEFSDQLAVYNVRQPNVETTSTQPTLSQSDNYDDYEDESNKSTTSSYPIADVEPSIEFSDQLAVYNIRTPTTTYPPSSVSQTEPSTAQPSVSFETPANYVNYEDEKQSSTFPPSEEMEPSIEFSDQLAVYNVREPLPSTTTSYPFVASSIQPSPSQSDNYINYENEYVSNQVPTTSSPKHEDQQYLEYSDQLAVYNVREPLPGTTTSSPLVTSSVQPSPSQSDGYMNYENEFVPNQVPTTSSPKHDDQQYLEYSDQLPVSNVRDPLSGTTTSSPLVTNSVQPSASQLDNYINYENEYVPSQVPTTSSPKPEDQQYLEYSDQLAVYNVREPLPGTTTSSPLLTSSVQPSVPQSDGYMNYENEFVPNQVPTTSSPKHEDQQYLEYSDQLPVYTAREPLPGTTTSSPLVTSSVQPSVPQLDNYINYENEFVPSQVPTTSSPKQEDQQYLEYSDQLAVYNVREPLPSSTTSSPLVTSSVQPSLESDSNESYDDEDEEQQTSTLPSPQPGEEQYLEYSDQLAVYNVREPLPTTTSYPFVASSIQPSTSQSDSYVNYENEFASNQVPTTSPPKHEDQQYLEYSDQLPVYNVREPLPGTTTSSPLVTNSVQPSVLQSDSYMNYENELVSNQVPTTSSPKPEDQQYLEYSDQLAVYNVREPLPGTTTSSPLLTSSVQPSVPQSDGYMNYENEFVPNQVPTTSSPKQEDQQYLEYSDQLAVYNVREPLPTTTTASPAVSENIPSGFCTTPSQSFPSYELDTISDQKTEVEPQSTFAPKFEEETYNFQPFTGQPQPSNEPATEYYGEYNEQFSSNQMPSFTTPAGKVYPTMVPLNEYVDNNGPESPLLDYSRSQDIGGFVSTSLPSPSYDTTSFNNFELQYDSQPTSTLRPTEPEQNQVFSDQVSDIREPQSDSSVSDGRISDVVTEISPMSESESTISSLNDSQQTVPSESQPEKSIANDYPGSFSTNQPLPNNYEIYYEQSSNPENEAPVTSVNEPTTYLRFPIDVITTSPENFAIYDDPRFSAESQGTYPPKIENESFANYDDYNNTSTSTAGQTSVSIKPLSDNDSSENEPSSSGEEPSSEEEEKDGNVAVSDDKGLLPLSPNTFRPTVQIETTVNYADQTPFRPIRLPSSLQENNIIYDEGILRNETEPSDLGGEEAANSSLIVSSELTKQNEGKDLDSSTTLAPELEFDTYYEKTPEQPSSSDAPKINNYMIYEDDEQPSSPKFDLNTTISNDYSTSVFPSTPSSSQQIVTTPSISEAMPETYSDYGYSKTDFNSQTTFPPQTESVLYDDPSTQDQSLTQQQQGSVDYAAYGNQIQSTSTAVPTHQEMIDFSDELSIYNVPETVLTSSSPSLSELVSSNMVTTTQPSIPSDRNNLEIELQPTFSPSVEPQTYDEQRPLPSKDLTPDTFINYQDTISSSPSPTTPLPPSEVEPSLEYSDELSVYDVRQPQPESPSSSSQTNEPTSIQPPALPESHSENYVNYEDGLGSIQLPTSTSPPKVEEPSIEFSDQLAVYNVRQPNVEPTSTQPTLSQSDNYDDYEDESNESTTSSSPTVNVESSLQYSDEALLPSPVSSPSPPLDENIPKLVISTFPPSSINEKSTSVQPTSSEEEAENENDYDDEIATNYFPSTLSTPTEEPSIELTDKFDIYDVRQPSTASPPSSVSYLEPSSTQTPFSPETQPEIYVSYDDGRIPTQLPTTSSPKPQDQQYLEYSDQLAVYNVREPLPSSTTSSPLITSSIQPSVSQSDSYINYENEFVPNQVSTVSIPQHEDQQYLEYSDQLPVSTAREPLPSTTTSYPLVISSVQPSVSQLDSYMNYENEFVPSQAPTTSSPKHEEEQYLEYSDQLAVYNVREPLPGTTTSSPLITSSVQPSSESDRDESYDDEDEEQQTSTLPSPQPGEEQYLEYSDQLAVYNVRESLPSTTTSSPLVATSIQPSTSQSDSYVNYENEFVPTPISTTSSPKPEDQQYLEYSDQLAVYNVREPLPGTTTSSPVVTSSIQSFVPQSDGYMNYENEFVPNQVPTTSSPKPEDQQYLEYSDQLAVYNVREPLPGTTTSSPVVTSSIQSFVPQSDGYMNYENEFVPNQVPTTSSPKPEDQQYLEYSDQLAVYNAREPLPSTTTSSPLVATSIQPSTSHSDTYVNYENEFVPTLIPTTSTPKHEDEQYLEYSDQLAVYNVREPLPGTTTSSPVITSSVQPSSSESDSDESYDDEDEEQQTSTSPSPQPGEEQYLEYSDQLAVYNVREPLPTTTTSSPAVIENIPSSFITTLPPLFSSDRIETYDDPTVGNELRATVAPETYDQPISTPATSFSPTGTPPENYGSGELSTSSIPPKSIDPFLEYSDQLSIYNVRQPSYSSSPSPVSESLVTTTVPSLPSDDFGTYDDRVEYMDSQPTFPSQSESQTYRVPTSVPSSVSQSDVYINYDENVRQSYFETTPSSPPATENVSSGAMSVSTMVPFPSRDSFQGYNSPVTSSDYVSTSSHLAPESQVNSEDYTVQKEELPSTPSTFNLAQSQDFTVPPPNYSAEQEFDYHPTSPPQSQDNYIYYEDQTVSNALTTTSSPVKEVEPSLEYSDQLAVYNVREPVFESTTAPIVSSSTTLSPPSLTDTLASPQPSPSESQSDSDDEYEDETPTTLSTPEQVEPSVEYSDQLAAFNVLGPVIVPIPATVVKENIPSGDVTTSLPSSTQSSSESQSDSDEDYEDETSSTPSPMIGDEPSLELSDELSIYNVRQRPSELSSPSPPSENMPNEAVTTLAPSLPSDKFESYDYQPVGFESQPTFSPVVESQVYNEPTSVPSTPSQSQDNYVNYGDEIKSNEPMTTLRPSVDIEPSVEYSDGLAIYNVQSPFSPSSSPSPLLNENIAVDTVPNSMPTPVYDAPTSAPSTSPQEQPDNYINYEDQLPSNEFPITYSPAKEEPPMTSSDQLSLYTTSPQSPPPVGYDYDSRLEYTDSQTIVPTEPSPPISNQPTSIRPLISSESQPEYVIYEDERPPAPLPTSTSSTSQLEPSLEYSDQLAVYNVREPLPGSTTLPPVVTETVPSNVVTTLSPPSLSVEPISVQPSSSESQSVSYEEYDDETASDELSTTLSPPVQVEPSVEYSDEVVVYNVREPLFTSTSPPVISENVAYSVVTTLPPSPSLSVEPISILPTSSESQLVSYEEYDDETASEELSTTLSPPVQVEPSAEYSDEVVVYNVREPIPGTTTSAPVVNENIADGLITTLSPSPSNLQSGNYYYVDYKDETISKEPLTTLPTPIQVEPFLEYSDEVTINNVRQPEYSSSPSPVTENIASGEPTSIPTSSSQPQTAEYINYEGSIVPNQPSSFLSSPMKVEPSLEYSDQLAAYNIRQPEYPSSSSPSPLNENYSNEMVTTAAPSQPSNNLVMYTDFQPTSSPESDSQMYDQSNFVPASSESQPDNYVSYEDKIVPSQASSTLSPPVQIEPSVEYSDEVAVYNVREPLFTSTLSPVVSDNIPSSIVTTLSPSPSSLNMEPISVQPSFESQLDYEDETALEEYSTTLSPPVQVEPSLEYYDEVVAYNVRERLPGTTTLSPVVNENIANSVVTTLPPSSSLIVEPVSVQPSVTESQSDSNEDYEDETVSTPSPISVQPISIQPSSNLQSGSYIYEDYKEETVSKEPLTTLSSPVQVQPSVEVLDEVAVYNVREPLPGTTTTLPSVVSENTLSSEVTTLSPSDTQSDSDEDYEDETVSTPSPVTSSEPSFEISDELSIYNVRQRPSQMTTPSPFTNSVISNFMTTLSPYFTFEESSSKDSLNTISQTTVPPKYETDMYDEESSIQPSQSNEDDSQPISDETTSKDFLPETLSNFDEQTISNVIQSTQSPDLSNQLYSENEVEYPKVSFITVQPNVESTVPPGPSFVPKAEQEFDYQPTLSPDYETYEKTMTTPPSSHQSQDNYVVYEDQTVPNELTTSSPVNEPSLEYSNQLAVNNVLLPETSVSYSTSTPPFLHDTYTVPPSSETYTDYEGSTANFNSLPTQYDEPRNPSQVQTSTSPQPRFVNYDYYNDRNQTPEESASTPTTEIDTTITLTEFGPTLLPNFESQVFDKPSETQTNNYVDYEDSVVTTQMPSSTSQTYTQPSIESSDELLVYNEPYLETTSIQPSSSFEPQPDHYDTYEDQVIVNELSTPSTSQKIENTVTQPTSAPEEPTQMYDTPTSTPVTPLKPQQDNYVNYDNEIIPYQPMTSTASTNQVQQPSLEYSDELAVYDVRESLPGTTTLPPVTSENIASSVVTTLSPSSLSVEPISVQPSSSESQSDSHEEYEDEMISEEYSTTLSPPVQVEPSVEYYDEVVVYNVRKSLPGTTTLPPVVNENIANSVVTTLPPSSSLIVEPVSVQPSDTESQSDSNEDYEDETVSTPSPISVQPISIQPSSNLQSGSYIYEDYKEETISKEPLTTLSTPVQVQPSVEVLDEVAVYNVREPLPGTTTNLPPVVSENTLSSVVTTLSPSDTQSDSDEDYEDETVSTPSPVTSYEPSFEISDELSIYNVRQRPSEMTTPSPFTNSVISNFMTTLSPYFTFSPNDNEGSTLPSSVTSEPEPEIYDQPYSTAPSSSESTYNNNLNFENEITSDKYSTPSPSTAAQESWSTESAPFEYPEQLSVYNVRQRPSDFSSPSPPNENFSDNVVTTSESPFSSNDNGYQKFTPEEEAKSYDNSNSAQKSSSEAQPENYASYEDVVVSSELPTSLPPTTVGQSSIEYSDELAIYDVRQPSTASPPSSVSYLEPSSTPTPFAPKPQLENYVSYDDGRLPTQVPTTSSPKHEDEQYLEYSDQLAVYNVREPLPSTTTSSPLITSSVQPSSESDSDESYDDEGEEQQTSTLSSPKAGEEQYLEYSDQLAVYNVREPLPSTTTSSPLVTSSIQPSVSQSDSYMNYENELVSNQVPTTFPPKQEDQQYLEYSDQLAVYNVRESLPSTTTSSPLVTSSVQPSASQSDNYINYENEFVPNQLPTTSSPKHEDQQYLEYSDQLAVYNVREPLPGTTTSSPLITSSIQPFSSESDSDESYDDEDEEQQTSTLSSPKAGEEQFLEYSDQLAVYNVREPLPSTTTSSPLVTSSIQPSVSQSDSYMNYENELVPNQVPTTSSPKHEDQQYLEYTDQLAVYNVREPLPATTTASPAVSESIPCSIMATSSPFFESDKLLTLDNELVETESQSTFPPQYQQIYDETKTTQPSFDSQPGSYVEYEDEFLTTIPPSRDMKTSFSNNIVTTPAPSVGYDYDSRLEYSDSQTVVSTEPLPPIGNQPTSIRPLISSESQPEYVIYEDERLPAPLPTSTSSTSQLEPSLEYSDQLAVYNVREPLPGSTTLPPIVTETVPSSVVTTLSPPSLSVEPISVQPSSSESQSDSYEEYEDETASGELSTTLSPPVQGEPSVEYSDEVVVYNVREPLPGTTTSAPIVNKNIADGLITTLPPSPSNLQSGNYYYVDYKDETIPKESLTTLPTPIQVEPTLEYSDEIAINNVRQPEYSSSSPSPPTENFANNLVSTVTPSLGGFETYDNQVVYTDFQPTFSPQIDSQMYDEPTSIPDSSSEPQTDNYVNYEDKMASNVAVTSASPPVNVDVEFVIYNVRQPSTASPLLSDIATTPSSSAPDYYSSEMPTSSPVSDTDRSYIFTDKIPIVREPELDSHVKAPNMFTTLPSFPQNPVGSEQNDYYTYDDQIDSQTTFSPETEIEYDEAPTSLEPQPSSSTQPPLETMVTTFQPQTESQINKIENKTSTPSNLQEASTFLPLHSFIPLNQPSYPLPEESKPISEQQDQVISKQVIFSPLVPSSALDSDKRSNSFLNLVQSQETRPNDGVENIQRDTPQPEPFALVPDQSNPSNETDRMVIRDKL